MCARDLLGRHLVWGRCRAVVVETEAYAEIGDAACHTFFRPSAREFVAAHSAGAAYVYLNYGMHWLFNVLIKGAESGFVLVRALEPVAGVAAMRRRRGGQSDLALCSGPGKLTQAMGITGRAHGRDLCSDPAHGFHWSPAENLRIVESPRIGISKATELPWRFHLEGCPHVSSVPRGGAKKAGRLGSRPA